MLILGLLLGTVGIILYSLVQIMQGQRSGEKTNSAAAAGSPVGQGAGAADGEGTVVRGGAGQPAGRI